MHTVTTHTYKYSDTRVCRYAHSHVHIYSCVHRLRYRLVQASPSRATFSLTLPQAGTHRGSLRPETGCSSWQPLLFQDLFHPALTPLRPTPPPRNLNSPHFFPLSQYMGGVSGCRQTCLVLWGAVLTTGSLGKAFTSRLAIPVVDALPSHP